MNRALCLCALIPKLNLKTKITLVIHAKELKRTTNTGRLALHALINSEIRIRGQSREGLDLSDLLSSDYQTFLFYPSQDAIELTAELIARDPRPVQLIVPDGNWRQASKVHYRHRELKNISRVMIKTPNLNQHHLRQEHSEEGMATLMAIAMALGVTEGEQIQFQLMALYQEKLQRTLRGRGIFSNSDSN